MKPVIFFAISILLVASCNKPNMSLPPAIPVPVLKFLALGDSYTIGQSVSAVERFPVRTAAYLRNAGFNVSDPSIIATTGWTTRDLLNALNAAGLSNDYSIVTLLIGVNNQYQGRSITEYQTEFTELLIKAIQLAGGNKDRVFVLSIPDYSVTPFAAGSDTARIADEIDIFNGVNRQVALSYGVNYIDITPISREGRFNSSLQASDGLHPSGIQYQRWVEILAPVIKSKL